MADLQTTETEAAELEGAVILDPATDLATFAKLERFRTLRAQKAELLEKLEQAKHDILGELSSRDATTLVHDGVVVARHSNVISTRTDGKRFKADHPELFAEYQIVTSSVRLTVSK